MTKQQPSSTPCSLAESHELDYGWQPWPEDRELDALALSPWGMIDRAQIPKDWRTVTRAEHWTRQRNMPGALAENVAIAASRRADRRKARTERSEPK